MQNSRKNAKQVQGQKVSHSGTGKIIKKRLPSRPQQVNSISLTLCGAARNIPPIKQNVMWHDVRRISSYVKTSRNVTIKVTRRSAATTPTSGDLVAGRERGEVRFGEAIVHGFKVRHKVPRKVREQSFKVSGSLGGGLYVHH